MSTRSFVGVLNEDDTVRGHYIHFDGYPEAPGVGSILLEHYRSITKISSMIELGDLSCLGPEIGEKHDFETHGGTYRNGERVDPGLYSQDWCLAYGRDRGEQSTEPRTYQNLDKFLDAASQSWAEYAYVYQGGRWVMYSENKRPGVDLEDYLKGQVKADLEVMFGEGATL